MLEHAKKLASEGMAVYVIAANVDQANQLARQLGGERMGVDIGGIKVETAQSVGNFDWDTCSLRGAHPNCIVLVDHYAAEQEIQRRISRLLKIAHEYDQPTE